MRDFRLPNVLTRHGIEGDYVVVDMEYAGPDCTEWSVDPLDKWDAGTLNQVSVHGAMLQSDSSLRPQRPQSFAQIAMEMQSALDKHVASVSCRRDSTIRCLTCIRSD